LALFGRMQLLRMFLSKNRQALFGNMQPSLCLEMGIDK
jgi:hypothetical protein